MKLFPFQFPPLLSSSSQQEMILFGILSLPVSKMLGQISYPIYLLHPIVLFVTFRFILGFDFIKQLSVINYWLIVCGCTVALIPICLPFIILLNYRR